MMGIVLPEPLPCLLLQLLSNTLILDQTVPYLPISSLLALSATSKSFQSLILRTPGVFRYLDLSHVRGAAVPFAPIDAGGEVWRSERMDEAVTEDDFYSGPLRGIFSKLERMNVLQDVQTLILDGLSVPADLVAEMMMDERFNIRILSIRESKNLNERKLMQALRYVCRSTAPRPPRLKGLYVFGPRDSPAPPSKLSVFNPPRGGITTSEGAQLGAIGSAWNSKSHHALSQALAPDWYQTPGIIFKKTPSQEWAETIRACEGMITFDAVLCRGIRHDINAFSHEDMDGQPFTGQTLHTFLLPTIASVSLGPRGCEICHSSAEGLAIWSSSPPSSFPLLAPPPLHSSTIVAAQTPPRTLDGKPLTLFASCESCLVDRRCESCNKFWCSNCYPPKPADSSSLNLTELQKMEHAQSMLNNMNDGGNSDSDEGAADKHGRGRGLKVFLGLCVKGCLVGEMMSGAGSGGMWG
jgi:hypothetical protein